MSRFRLETCSVCVVGKEMRDLSLYWLEINITLQEGHIVLQEQLDVGVLYNWVCGLNIHSNFLPNIFIPSIHISQYPHGLSLSQIFIFSVNIHIQTTLKPCIQYFTLAASWVQVRFIVFRLILQLPGQNIIRDIICADSLKPL